VGRAYLEAMQDDRYAVSLPHVRESQEVVETEDEEGKIYRSPTST